MPRLAVSHSFRSLMTTDDLALFLSQADAPRAADVQRAFDEPYEGEAQAVLLPIAREVGLGDVPFGALALQLIS